jgi:hypothetical protein
LPSTTAPTPPIRVESADAEALWHYAIAGRRLGPVKGTVITELLADDTLTNETLVWKQGLDNWIPIANTTMRRLNTEPPPLTGTAVNNNVVWIVAFAPIIGELLEHFVGDLAGKDPSKLWFITLALNIGLCFLDEHLLKQAGHDATKFAGWAFLVPVYLYQRATTLKQPLSYFTTWLICFFISLLM